MGLVTLDPWHLQVKGYKFLESEIPDRIEEFLMGVKSKARAVSKKTLSVSCNAHRVSLEDTGRTLYMSLRFGSQTSEERQQMELFCESIARMGSQSCDNDALQGLSELGIAALSPVDEGMFGTIWNQIMVSSMILLESAEHVMKYLFQRTSDIIYDMLPDWAKVGTYLASFLGVKEVSAIWNGYQLLGDSDKTVRELRSTAWKIAKTLLYAWTERRKRVMDEGEVVQARVKGQLRLVEELVNREIEILANQIKSDDFETSHMEGFSNQFKLIKATVDAITESQEVLEHFELSLYKSYAQISISTGITILGVGCAWSALRQPQAMAAAAAAAAALGLPGTALIGVSAAFTVGGAVLTAGSVLELIGECKWKKCYSELAINLVHVMEVVMQLAEYRKWRTFSKEANYSAPPNALPFQKRLEEGIQNVKDALEEEEEKEENMGLTPKGSQEKVNMRSEDVAKRYFKDQIGVLRRVKRGLDVAVSA